MSVTRVLLGQRWEAEGKSPQASKSVSLVQKPTLSSCLRDQRPRLPSDLHKCSPPYSQPHHPHLLPTPLYKHDLKKKFKKHLLSNPIYSSIPPSYFKSSSQTFKAKWGSSWGTLALYNKCDPKNPCVNLYF